MKKLSPNVKLLRALLAKKGYEARLLRALIPPTTLARHLCGVRPSADHIIDYEMAFGWRARDWQTDSQWKRSAKRTHKLVFGHVMTSTLPDSVYDGPGLSEKP